MRSTGRVQERAMVEGFLEADRSVYTLQSGYQVIYSDSYYNELTRIKMPIQFSHCSRCNVLRQEASMSRRGWFEKRGNDDIVRSQAAARDRMIAFPKSVAL